jgi:drug/metabolite transporter (DMT)-like permease
MRRIKFMLLLQVLMMGYSFGGVLSKIASSQPVFSGCFCLCYSGLIAVLGIYALAWQQIIKHLPLTTAFANKAITVVWGLVWGAIIFRESITWGKISGAALVVAGVIIFTQNSEEAEKP